MLSINQFTLGPTHSDYPLKSLRAEEKRNRIARNNQRNRHREILQNQQDILRRQEAIHEEHRNIRTVVTNSLRDLESFVLNIIQISVSNLMTHVLKPDDDETKET
ncbi:hypothetical protein SESBI_48225 [Sesbania bispinosa]|nr:hypothetical protein SESBI_48225 [Sesbania bispinosa]